MDISIWIYGDTAKYIGLSDTEIEQYENDPIPKFHTDLMKKLSGIPGLKEIQLYLYDTPPFKDEYIFKFTSYTKMVKAIRKIDEILNFIYDKKMLLNLEENTIMVQW